MKIKSSDLEKKSLEQTGKKIISKLESYLYFINLYKKERPLEARSIIEQIIKEDKSIISRIEKIEEIDRNTEDGIEDYGDYLEKKEDANKQERKEAVKLTQGSFLNYIFVYRSKLVKFGLRTRTISFDFFGLKKKKSAHSIALWEGVYADVKEYLHKQLNYVLFNAWEEEDVLPYNIIVVFNKFISRFIRVGKLVSDNNSYHRNVKVVDLFIKPYLSILYNNDYKEILKGTVFKILSSHSEYEKDLTKTISVIDGITNIDKRDLSFFNIILSFYSISYNRFVKYEELLMHYAIREIESEHFNFNKPILDIIKSSIVDMDISIKDIEDKLFLIKYISFDEKDEEDEDEDSNDPWISLFNSLSNYEYHTKKTDRSIIGKSSLYDKNPFSTLSGNLLLGIVRVSKGFIAYYNDILQDMVSVQGDASHFKVRIFDNAFLSDELSDLEVLTGEYSHRIFESAVVNIDQYYIYISNRELPLKEDEKLCKFIEKIIYLYKNIAYKLCNVLLLNKDVISSSSSAELLEKYKSKDEAIEGPSSSGNLQSRFIPYYSSMIVVHPFLDGKKVIDVIDEVVFFSLNLIYFFRETDIVRRCGEKDELINNMEHYLSIKGKMAL